MLSRLRIRNLAIVRDLSLGLGEGLTLLTGETGAGKSILLEALGLVLGDRASAEMIRAGESKAEIEAIFELGDSDAEALALLASTGVEPDGSEVVLRREIVASEGEAVRTRQYLCDSAVSLGTLRKFGELMVEVQGQHQHHRLLAPEIQRDALDRFAGAGEETGRLRGHARVAAEAAALCSELERGLIERSSRLDYLRFQLEEIDALSPSGGEEGALRAERARLQHAGRRRELSEGAYAALYEDESSLLEGLERVRTSLARLGELDPETAGLSEKVSQTRQSLEEVALALRTYRQNAEPDPERLDAVESRLAQYERLARKHSIAPSDLGEKRESLRAEAAGLESQEERIGHAREEASRAREVWIAAARALSARRQEAARRLSAALVRELGSLGMDKTEVVVEVRPEEPGAEEAPSEHGLDRIGILLTTNPGEPPRPLAEIASGGELSRVMLAVNTILGGGTRRTLVFDEVDAGIGGRTAEVVGEKLRALAGSNQVIVVTHLPQIASLADAHFAVTKKLERGRTVAVVRELDREGRVAEIARMMGGREVSTLARRHAAEMIRKSVGRSERRSP